MKNKMMDRQFLMLLLCNMVVLWVCAGLIPLLPLYAGELGASPAIIGSYFAVIFGGTFLGSISTGRLVARFKRRNLLLMVNGAVSIPATFAMGQVGNVWQLIALTTVVWFLGGVTLALTNVLVGLTAGKCERGKAFGLLALSSALGSLFGGLMTGPVADGWGYPVLFAVLALFWIIQIAVASQIQEDQSSPQAVDNKLAVSSPVEGRHGQIIAILVSFFALSAARAIGSMAWAIAMDGQGFPAAAVTMVSALGAGFGLVLNPLAGRLSDRLGRRAVLSASFVAGVLTLLTIAVAGNLAMFFLVALLMTVVYAADAVVPALVTDLAGGGQLDRAMSRLQAARWGGAIIGYAGVGIAVQAFGLAPTLVMSALLPGLSVLLLVPMDGLVQRLHLPKLHLPSLNRMLHPARSKG